MSIDWRDPLLQAVFADANLSIEVQLWHSSFDPLTAPCWWQWREPCDCPDTSFGRNPHRWNCAQTPIWAQTMRDLDTNPWAVVSSVDASYTVLWMRTFCCYGCGNPRDEGVHGASEYGGCV